MHEHRHNQPEPVPDDAPTDPVEGASPATDRHPADTDPVDEAAGPRERDDSLEQADEATPRIWVASLADYTNAILHGAWIDANQSSDDLQVAIRQMLAASPWTARTGEPAEEWAIFDHENFGNLRIGEYEDLSWVSAVAKGIVEHGPAFAAWAEVMQDEDMLDGFTDTYRGHYDSVEDYAGQLVDDLGYEQILDDILPDDIRRYITIDTTALARDMQLGGDIHVIPADDGGVWMFDAHQ